MDTFVKTLRQTLRSLGRTRSFTWGVVVTLALGIGANTAVYEVVSAVLLRPLPYRDSERIVRVFETFPAPGGRGEGSVAYPNFLDWREQTRSFSDLAAYTVRPANLQLGDQPRRVTAVPATPNLFTLLGVEPRIGRGFAPGRDGVGDPAVVVLSDAFWKDGFGGDRGVVGRKITLDGEPYTVAGVMPASFRFPAASAKTDVWLPLRVSPAQAADRGSHWASVIGRLEPGVSDEIARTEMAQIASRLALEYPKEQKDRGAGLVSLHEAVIGNTRPTLLILLGAAGLVLLIACANTANLLLTRAASRRREIAIRTALGASRGQVIGNFLLESLVLAMAGAALGLVISHVALRALVRMADGILPRAAEISFDLRSFLYLIGVTVVAAGAVGVIPALQASGRDPQRELREGGAKSSAGRAGRGFRNTMVAAQVALSFVLLVGSGLLLRTLALLLATDTGLRTEGVLTMQVSPSAADYPDQSAARRFYRPVLERVAALPGVRGAGWITNLPLASWGFNGDFAIDGRPASGPDAPFAEWRGVSPGYFAAVGVPVLRGEALATDDTMGVLINKALADRYFPGADPIGQGIVLDRRYPIRGVVGNVRQAELALAPMPELYFNYMAQSPATLSLVVRTDLPAGATLAAVRAAIAQVDPRVPVARVRSLDDVVHESVASQRLFLSLVGIFGAVALALAAAGLYAVIAYTVAERTREFGIRLALGSGTGELQRMVARQGAWLAALGLLSGVPLAWVLTRVLRGLLYGVTETDPLVFTAAALLLSSVAVVASFVPARRAAHTSPMIALRAE